MTRKTRKTRKTNMIIIITIITTMTMIIKAEKLRNTESAPSFTIVASLSTWVSSDDFVARKWPRDVVRAKGICYFDDERDMCYVFEQAGKQKLSLIHI